MIQSIVPVTMTSYRKKFFVDIKNLETRSWIIHISPISNDRYPYKRKTEGDQAHGGKKAMHTQRQRLRLCSSKLGHTYKKIMLSTRLFVLGNVLETRVCDNTC